MSDRKRVAIAVLHGLSSEKQFYSVEFKHRVMEAYLGLNENFQEEDLIFQEIYWGDLVGGQIQTLFERINYRNDLTYLELRRILIDYLGITHAYRSGHRNALYLAIHDRIRNGLRKLAAHKRVDAHSTPLVVIAHSLGGVFFSDYAWDLSEEKSLSGMTDDVVLPLERLETFAGFVTFGNPMAMLAAMNPEQFNRPVRVGGNALDEVTKANSRWYNFYDKDDIIACPLKKLNSAYEQAVSEDIEVNVGSVATSWNPACHNGYWEDKDFYQPVAEFLSQLRAEHVFW